MRRCPPRIPGAGARRLGQDSEGRPEFLKLLLVSFLEFVQFRLDGIEFHCVSGDEVAETRAVVWLEFLRVM